MIHVVMNSQTYTAIILLGYVSIWSYIYTDLIHVRSYQHFHPFSVGFWRINES